MKKEFEEFEDLTAKIFSILVGKGHTVERDIKLEGPDGPRQIDVLIESNFGPLSVRTMVECKDTNRKITITDLDQLHSKRTDVSADVAVLVSRKGFTKKAVSKAKRLGIKLYTAHEAMSKKWGFEIDIPVVIEELTPKFSIYMEVYLNKGNTLSKNLTINEIPIIEKFYEVWNNDKLNSEVNGAEVLDYLGISQPFYLKDVKTQENLLIDDIDFKVSLERLYYLGNLRDLGNSLLLDNIMNGEKDVIFDMEKIKNYRKSFAMYEVYADLPVNGLVTVRCTSKEIMQISKIKGSIDIKKIPDT